MPAATKTTLLFKLAALLLLTAPLSVAGFAFAEPFKYIRLAITIVMVALGFFSSRGARLGPVGRALAIFTVVFVVSGVWSNKPHWALIYKGMFAFMCLSGVVLINSVRTRDELMRGLRFLGLTSAIAAVLAFGIYLKNPHEAEVHGRMALAGMNSNTIGETAGPLLILCLFLVLHDKSRKKRPWMMGLACAVLVLILLGSGSRASALMAMVGALFLMVPLTRRPELFAGIGLMTACLIFVASEVLQLGGAGRLSTEMSKNTRTGVWWWAVKCFLKSPLIGVGWLNYGGHQWAAVQSSYFQVLAEAGLLGVFCLLAAIVVMLSKCHSNHVTLGRNGLPKDLSYLTLAFVVSGLVHGVFESSMVLGTSVNALFLGMGAGLADRTVALAQTGAMNRCAPMVPVDGKSCRAAPPILKAFARIASAGGPVQDSSTAIFKRGRTVQDENPARDSTASTSAAWATARAMPFGTSSAMPRICSRPGGVAPGQYRAIGRASGRPREEYVRRLENDDSFAGSELVLARSYGRRSPWRRFAYSPQARNWLRQRMKVGDGRPDVVHIHGIFSHITTTAARFAQKAGIPYVVRPAGTMDPAGLRDRSRAPQAAVREPVSQALILNRRRLSR